MPLTPKGNEIMKSMVSQYGSEKGQQVFYASKNAGKISGVEAHRKLMKESRRAKAQIRRAQGR